jgi:hypothetical protein
MGEVPAIPPALITPGQFQRSFPELCSTKPGHDPLYLADLVVEATAWIENAVDRRLAPFTNLQETDRLYGIDPTEYGASTDSPLDIYGSLGLSKAQAYQDDSLVRHYWLRQAAPHYPELWTYSVHSITLHLTYGNIIKVDPTSIEGPWPDDGHMRFRLGTFAPEGTTIVLVYGGGYTVGIPPDLQRLCKYKAAKLLMLDLEPQQRKEMNWSEIDAECLTILSNWTRG